MNEYKVEGIIKHGERRILSRNYLDSIFFLSYTFFHMNETIIKPIHGYIPNNKSYQTTLDKLNQILPPSIYQSNWLEMKLLSIPSLNTVQIQVTPWKDKPYKYVIVFRLNPDTNRNNVIDYHNSECFVQFSREENNDGFHIEMRKTKPFALDKIMFQFEQNELQSLWKQFLENKK